VIDRKKERRWSTYHLGWGGCERGMDIIASVVNGDR